MNKLPGLDGGRLGSVEDSVAGLVGAGRHTGVFGDPLTLAAGVVWPVLMLVVVWPVPLLLAVVAVFTGSVVGVPATTEPFSGLVAIDNCDLGFSALIEVVGVTTVRWAANCDGANGDGSGAGANGANVPVTSPIAACCDEVENSHVLTTSSSRSRRVDYART